MTPEVTVVVLAYNEENNVRASVTEIVDEMRRLGAAWEVLIVDDGSTDRTGSIADELAASEPHVRVVHHEKNQGLGGGYRTGFGEAKGTFITFYPADGQFPADIITMFFRQMNELDMILGYIPPEVRFGRSPLARAASLAERVLYRALLGKMPRYQGVLMFRRSMLGEIELVSTGRGWGIIMELVLRASRKGYRCRSVPTALRRRMSGESKVMNRRAILANIRQLRDIRRALGEV